MNKVPSKKRGRRRARVFVVDALPIVRIGISGLINAQRDMTVCGESDGGNDTICGLFAGEPDVAVVGLTLGKASGLTLIKHALDKRPGLPFLIFSSHEEPFYVRRSLEAGARGYITKTEEAETILTAIRTLLRGENYVAERLGSILLRELVPVQGKQRASATGRLTPREFEVLQLIGQGNTVRAISQMLHRSVKTVAAHRENIRKKLHLGSANEVLHYAAQLVASDTWHDLTTG